MHKYIHIQTYTYIHAYMHTFVHAYMHRYILQAGPHYSIDHGQWKNGINRWATCKRLLNDPVRQQPNGFFTNSASS